jgi:hypothetical protein
LEDAQVTVIGLLASAEDAALCLTNLAEADFAPAMLSLVLRTPADVAEIARLTGPWNALPLDQLGRALSQTGLSAAEAAEYVDAVRSGRAFLAIAAADADVAAAAQEMLEDSRGRAIRVLPIDRKPVEIPGHPYSTSQ